METRQWNGEYRGTYLGNGYLGQRMMQTGTGMGPQGPLPAYAAGLYEAEHLATIPSPIAPEITIDGRRFGSDAAHVKDYRQSLHMRTGSLETVAAWDSGRGPIQMVVSAFLVRQQPELAVLLVSFKAERDLTVQIARPSLGPTGDFEAPAEKSAAGSARRRVFRSRSGQSVLVQEERLLSTERVESAPGEPLSPQPGGHWTIELTAGRYAGITLVTATAWAPTEAEAAARVARALPTTVDQAYVKRILTGHADAWERLWDADIAIQGNPVEQQLARSWRFYLLQSVRAGSADSIPPMGLSDSAFSGHVFWDAETWMFPSLLLQHPELARSMLEYRCRTLPGAMANARAEGKRGASYAWESASTGREQTPAGMPSRHGRHVTGDIALAFWQYWLATQDRAWLASRAWPVLSATADYWASRAAPEPGGGFGIRQVATPDENAGVVDNSAWTNYIARRNLELAGQAARILGRKPHPQWARVGAGLKLPRNPTTGLILQQEGYRGGKIKQTDVLLLIHPGRMPLSEAEKAKLFDYYAEKTIDAGPAMSDSIHAIVAAELGREAEAYKYLQESYQPFLRPPFLYFSEKRTRDNLYFHTGAGGCLQSILYGFAGLRIQDRDRPTVEHPLLPAAWQSLEIRRIRWRGKDWDLRLEKGKLPQLTARW